MEVCTSNMGVWLGDVMTLMQREMEEMTQYLIQIPELVLPSEDDANFRGQAQRSKKRRGRRQH